MQSPRRAFRFALCADDYAMTPGVSRGILEALDAGALSATSAMTTSPWWPEAAGALRRHEDAADIGLHLNLTLGAPLGPMPTLAPFGTLPSIGMLLRRARGGMLPLEEIAEEIDRQCERFETVFGRPPDHVDGHQHVQALPQIRALLQSSLTRRGWRCWLRDSADNPVRIIARGTSLKKALGLALVGRGFRRAIARSGFASNAGFAGFSDFDPAASYPSQFRRYLRSPGPRHLVMCHPGIVDDELKALDPVVATREQELSFLTSRDFETTLASEKGALARLSEMPDVRGAGGGQRALE